MSTSYFGRKKWQHLREPTSIKIKRKVITALIYQIMSSINEESAITCICAQRKVQL